MHPRIIPALSLKFPPLAIFYAQEPPSDAKEMRSLCSMLLVAQAAMGRTMAITRGTCRCPGAGKGLGLEPSNHGTIPGGGECYLHFFPTRKQDLEHGHTMIQKLTVGGASQTMTDDRSGREYLYKTLEGMVQRPGHLPRLQPEAPYVVLKPLEALVPDEKPKVVSLLIEPDQLPALVSLSDRTRPGIDRVWLPFTAGCASMVLYPLHDAERTNPRAIIGLTDTSTRFYLRKALGKEVVAFTVPWGMFVEMEETISNGLIKHCA